MDIKRRQIELKINYSMKPGEGVNRMDVEQSDVDRRRGRRVSLEAPLLIRRFALREAGPFTQQATKNISLAGVYFETEADQPYTIGDVLMTSVSIPEPQRREFPFTRLAGPSRVVRVHEVAEQGQGKRRLGIALEFGDNTTALTATPPRG